MLKRLQGEAPWGRRVRVVGSAPLGCVLGVAWEPGPRGRSLRVAGIAPSVARHTAEAEEGEAAAAAEAAGVRVGMLLVGVRGRDVSAMAAEEALSLLEQCHRGRDHGSQHQGTASRRVRLKFRVLP